MQSDKVVLHKAQLVGYLYYCCLDGYISPIVVVVLGGADFGCLMQLHLMSVLLSLLYL